MHLTPKGYKPRLIDTKIDKMLETFGAISIEGPKWCGKTWTAENHAGSEFRIQDNIGPIRNRDRVEQDHRVALIGERPHLIDEWQEVPPIWDAVRSEVDKCPDKGQFILTGSSVPRRDSYIHSGAGRIGKVKMRTMSLYETEDSNGSVSLADLFNSDLEPIDLGEIDIETIIRFIIRGGWPGSIELDTEKSLEIPRQYIEYTIEDAARLDGKRRSSDKIRMLIRSLARNESTLASDARIRSDMTRFDEESIAIETYYEYIDCLERLHLIDEIPCFKPNVRSSLRIGKTPKRHMTDVSLAVAALELNEDRLKNDLETLGFMFESLCLHDLQLYAEANGWKLFHYRDGRGHEIDAVVETHDGSWGAFEIKLGHGQIDGAARNLLKIAELFGAEGTPPSVLCVICGLTTYAYRRPDGVFVVPITALRP